MKQKKPSVMLRTLRTLRILLLAVPAVAMVAAGGCKAAPGKTQDREFALRCSAIYKDHAEKVKNAVSARERTDLKRRKTESLEKLIGEYGQKTSGHQTELLKIRVLMDLSRLEEADQRIAYLLRKKSKFILQAQLLKVRLLVRQGKADRALELFKALRPRAGDGKDRFAAWLYLALGSTDDGVRAEYSRKVMESGALPDDLARYRVEMYLNLAAAARDAADPAEARNMLGRAVAAADTPVVRGVLQGWLQQLELVGKPAPPIAGETWINTPPLTAADRKNRVVVLFFWAPWNEPGRRLFPLLQELHGQYNDVGLTIIGYTKLYGQYSDDTGQRDSTPKEEELERLKQLAGRLQAAFPIAVSAEGTAFRSYTVTGLPTLVFIDKAGTINDIEVGAGRTRWIREKIKSLLNS